ncbi:MAG: hypothetical protein LW724_17740, partial [Planctomycetaceae bacterium]|nr:hypothetical protein [Planctomycetaceae bacterium]
MISATTLTRLHPGLATRQACRCALQTLSLGDRLSRIQFVQRLARLLFKMRCPVGKNEIRHSLEVN